MLSCVVALSLLFAPGGQVDLSTPRDLVERANAVLAAGDAAQAERLFREILTDYPVAIDAYRGLAMAYVEQGRSSDAVRMLVASGSRMQQAGMERRFRPLLELAVEIDPASSAAHYMLGSALSADGSHQSAARHFQTALDLGDTQVATRVSLAAALWEAGDLEASEANYRTALDASRRHPIVLHQYATLLLFQGRNAEARDLLTEVSQAGDPSVYVLLDLARALQGTDEIEAALAATRAGLAVAPDLLRAHFQLATLLARSGDRVAAARASAEYRRLWTASEERLRESSRIQAHIEDAQGLWLLGDGDRVLEVIDGLPETVAVLELRAAVYSERGVHDEAIAALDTALGLEPDRRDLQAWLARERDAEGSGGR